ALDPRSLLPAFLDEAIETVERDRPWIVGMDAEFNPQEAARVGFRHRGLKQHAAKPAAPPFGAYAHAQLATVLFVARGSADNVAPAYDPAVRQCNKLRVSRLDIVQHEIPHHLEGRRPGAAEERRLSCHRVERFPETGDILFSNGSYVVHRPPPTCPRPSQDHDLTGGC